MMKKLLLSVLFLFLAQGWAGATLSIVQSAVVAGTGTQTNTVTLGSSPTAGNILIVFAMLLSGDNGMNAPDGTWTKLDHASSGVGSVLYAWWHPVTSGNGTTYTFTNGYNEQGAISIYEITGQDSITPINQHAITTYTFNPSSVATPSVTPSVIGTLALSAAAANWGGTTATVSTGWGTALRSSDGDLFSSVKNNLTTDTTTAISNTFTFTGASGYVESETILIAPASTAVNHGFTRFLN